MALLTIGRRAAAQHAVGLLVECHERIRSFVALARTLAEATDRPAPQVAEAAEGVRKYFSSSFLTHVRDEEELLLPLLRGFEPALDEALAAMHEEHVDHEAPLAEVIAIASQLANAPERLPALAVDLGRAAAQLEERLGPHLAREETTIFPAVDRLVAPEVRAALFAEMKRRRGG